MSYSIATQTPQYRIHSLQDLENIPVTGPNPAAPPEILASLASVTAARDMPVGFALRHSARDRYLRLGAGPRPGRGAQPINQIIAETAEIELPRGSQVIVRGQILTMRSSYFGLLGGLAFSIILVYLLIVVNFQSWLDPFIIISALPAALAGIVWFLFVTPTTISVPALTGSIMCMGVATANSILVVSFAKEQMEEGKDRDRGAALRGRVHAVSPGADDRPGHDHRHGADGAGIGRRRRAECAAGPRRDRRSAVCDRRNSAVRASPFQRVARTGAAWHRRENESKLQGP